MKRLFTLLILACDLFAVTACHYDIALSVDASAELYYDNGDVVRVDPVTYGGLHDRILSDSDLEWMFIDLTQHVNSSFKTAILNLAIYDEISGNFLRNESYGVVYNNVTGHYDFAELVLTN